MEIDRVKELLRAELGYLPEGDGLDGLLCCAERLALPPRQVLIEAGQMDPDVYVVADGIMRLVDMDGDKERTFAFALPGTMFMSKHSFVMRLPSYYRVQACCETVLLKIPHKLFWETVETDHRLALWALRYAYGELFCQEHKFSNVHNGSARERLAGMMTDRPLIIQRVPQRIIASYLGITPEYFSHLRRELSAKSAD